MCWRPALSWMPRARFLQTRPTITPKMCSTRLSAATPTSSCFASRSRNDGISELRHLAPWVLQPRRQRRRIGCGLGNLAQPVAIGMVKRLGLAGDRQQRVLLVRPCTVGVDVDLDRVAIRAECLLEKGVRDNTIGE